jgi:hypothetical protein
MPRIDHTIIEYDTIRAELQDYMFNNYPDNWNDFLENNAGQMLLELFSYFGDINGFRVDAAANEVFVPTLQSRESMLKLFTLVDYQMKSIQQASTVVSAIRSDGTTTNQLDVAVYYPALNISTMLRAKNKNGDIVPFTIMAGKADYETSVILPRTKSFVDGVLTDVASPVTEIMAYEGVVRTDIVTDITGEDNQRYLLSGSPVFWNTIKVWIDSGSGWQPLENNQYLINVKPQQILPIYRIEWDSNNRAFLVFGSAKYGPKPEVGHKLKFVYMVGNDKDGNIGRLGIDVSQTCYCIQGQSLANTIRINFQNDRLPASGGKSQESVDEARAFAPLLLRTSWKLASREDYNILISSLDSVRLAKAASDQENDLVPNYTVFIYVFPNGIVTEEQLYELNPTVQKQVEDFINGTADTAGRKVIGIDNVVLPAHVLKMNIVVDLVKKEYYDNATIDNEIFTIFNNYFNPQLNDTYKTDNVDFDFGREINIDSFRTQIASIKGVSYVKDISIDFVSPLVTDTAIILPAYPYHEDIILQTQRKALDSVIEIMYHRAVFNPYEDTANEYLAGQYDDTFTNSNVDSNYRCYRKLKNNKSAITFIGRKSTLSNSWLRFAFSDNDLYSYRRKTYRGSNHTFDSSSGNLVTAATAATVKNTVSVVSARATISCPDGDAYSPSAYGKTLVVNIDGVEFKLTIPTESEWRNDSTLYGAYPDGINCASTVASYINYVINLDQTISVDQLTAGITASSELVLYSYGDTVTVYDSALLYPTTSSLHTVVGLADTAYAADSVINYLPCASDVLLKEGENTLMLKINGQLEYVTLPTSNPTTYYVNVFDSADVGIYNNASSNELPVFIRTFPNPFKLVEDNNEFVVSYNDEFVLDDETATSAKSINSIFVRIQRTNDGLCMLKQPIIHSNQGTFKHFDSDNWPTSDVDAKNSAIKEFWGSSYKWSDFSGKINPIANPGLYSQLLDNTGTPATYVPTTIQYYFSSASGTNAWNEISVDLSTTTYMTENNFYNMYIGNVVDNRIQGVYPDDFDDNDPQDQIMKQKLLNQVNTVVFKIPLDNVMGDYTGFQKDIRYTIDIKSRKDYSTTTRVVPSKDSIPVQKILEYRDAYNGIMIDYWNRNGLVFESTGSVPVTDERPYDGRTQWMDNDAIQYSQQELDVYFNIDEYIDVNYVDSADPLVITADMVSNNKATQVISNSILSDGSHLILGTRRKLAGAVAVIDPVTGQYYIQLSASAVIVNFQAQLPWSMTYRRLQGDKSDTTATGTLTVDIVNGAGVTDYYVEVGAFVAAINSSDCADGLNDRIYASTDGNGNIYIQSYDSTASINDIESYSVFDVLDVSGDFSSVNVLKLFRDDLIIGETEVLTKTNVYYIRIKCKNRDLDNESTIYIPFYYYASYDYDGAMNRTKLAQTLASQVPNINMNTSNLITPSEYQIPFVADDSITVNIS